MSDPLVSILMPAYNCEKYVGFAIDAVLHQSFRDFEFIIINDGSTDNTKKIIENYRDERIKFYENEINSGIVNTLNKGLALAKGKYILRTDADDIAMEYMASDLVKFMEMHDDYVACGGNMKLIGSEKIFSYPSNDNDLKIYTLSGCPFSHSTVIFRKSVLDKNNLRYNDFFKDAEDYGLWSELLVYGKFHNLNKVTLQYRESDSQVTSTLGYEERRKNSLSKIYSLHASKYFNFQDKDAVLYSNLILGNKALSINELERQGELIINILKKNYKILEKSKARNFFFIKWHSLCFESYDLGKSVFIIYFKYILLSKNFFRAKSLTAHFFKLFN